MDKIKILVVPSDTVGGVGFYRSFQPHIYLNEHKGEEYEIEFNTNPDWGDIKKLEEYNIIHVHKGLFGGMQKFYEALVHLKSSNTITVLDIDDFWDLSPTHPQYAMQKQYQLDQIIINNIKLFDYVTTTTCLFAKEIYKYNKHVFVFPNAIDPTDERFKIEKPKSDKIRVGMIMGSAHEHDVILMKDFIKQLKPETIEKIEIVLCGFDLRGSVRTFNTKTGKVTERPLQPKETVWYRYEQMLTNNYTIVSPEYKKFLNLFVSNLEYPNVEKEHYRRCWTKDINHYYSHYNNVDILLAPLEPKLFNHVKSELKGIECCFSNTALIASDYGPYKETLTNYLNKDGSVNHNGTAILIPEEKNRTDWSKAIELLVNDPEKLKELQDNLHNDFKDKYDLRNVCENRSNFYKEILKYSK
jgi:glycosyltransferase involved in cell wall biosynthesis